MDKNKKNNLLVFKRSVFTKGILVSCMALGFAGCSETRQAQFNPYTQTWGTVPSHQAASYLPYGAKETPYVRVAQNNTVPGLRGPYQVRKAILQQYHFDDYPRNYVVSDMPTQTQTLPQTPSVNYYIPQEPVNGQRAYFQHHLEESAPQRVINTQLPTDSVRVETAPVRAVAPVQPRLQSPQQSQPEAYSNLIPEGFKSEPLEVDNFQSSYQGAGTSLTQSRDKAISQSSRLAIEDIRIQEAEEQLEQAKSQGRFRLNLDGTVGAGQNETTFRVIDRTDSDFRVNRRANLNLSLPLYQGGGINAQKDVAKTDVQTAKANYQAVQSDIVEQAGIAHLNVLRDRALVEVYERNVALLQTQQNTVEALLGAGENTITDQALVDARLASIQARLKQVQSTLSASESRYKKLTGYATPALSPIQEVKLPASLQEAKDTAFSNNAELQTIQSESESAFHNIRVAKSLGRPKLALQGNLRAAEGQSDTIQRSTAAELLLNLSVPILSGGENKSRVRQAALEQSRAALEIRSLQENLNERIEQLWAAVSAAQQSRAPNLAQKAAAETAYQAILLQRKSGVATSLDVLSIEQTLLDSELNIIQADNAEGVARLQILGLMGTL